MHFLKFKLFVQDSCELWKFLPRVILFKVHYENNFINVSKLLQVWNVWNVCVTIQESKETFEPSLFSFNLLNFWYKSISKLESIQVLQNVETSYNFNPKFYNSKFYKVSKNNFYDFYKESLEVSKCLGLFLRVTRLSTPRLS